MNSKAAVYLSISLLLTLAPPIESRRGGGGGFSRGSSGARSRSGGGGGLFGGRSGGGSRISSGNNYQRNTHIGHRTNHGYNQNHGSGGGLFGSKHHGSHKTHSGHQSYHQPRFHTSTYSKGRGIGSVVRSNSFKNFVVGAAAGYLTYQAGKAIIRAATGPMMWNNRPYYWGSNYYRPSAGMSKTCRMPIDSSDPQFGNVYFSDQSRPREIVWGCGYYEYCCGYECCRGGSSAYGFPFGYTMILLFVARFYLL